ncbi:hypothetical protein KM043_010484 [Ampulex compressa]|nr:hypothetical protein KM043_010484 [Ampulex compressa]
MGRIEHRVFKEGAQCTSRSTILLLTQCKVDRNIRNEGFEKKKNGNIKYKMSTRCIRKIYGDDISLKMDKGNTSEEDVIIDNVKSKFNVFNVLSKSSDSGDEEEAEERGSDDVCSGDVKPKKKRKKRKKAKSQKDSQSPCKDQGEEKMDEIERTVREVNKLLGEPMPSCSAQECDNSQWDDQKSKDILAIQYKHLNPYNELKRIFGSKTIQAEQSKRRNRTRSGHLKKTWLVSVKETWPPIGKSGLTMSIDNTMGTSGPVQYFVYEHSPTYRQVQKKFLDAVESLNPENIIGIVRTHPCHVDALLQVAELAKLSENLATAAQFIESALYCLEYAFHPMFNITTGNCRLDYRKQQNRALFIALFKHMGLIGGRACYRTSLELCKLILSLDPVGDPLAVVLCLDFYALRAREYGWFIDFCDAWDGSRNLTQLPNIAYSLALANFHLGNRDTADELLQIALLMFPGVLMQLVERCNVQTDQKVMTHHFFTTKAKATTPPALEKLQDLYIVRSYHFWKEADILPWLEHCVHLVLARVDSKDDYIQYCEMKRSKRYRGTMPRNILRHIMLSDIKEVMVDIEEIQQSGPVLSHDPLPPTDSIDIYKRRTVNELELRDDSNLLSLFVSALFRDYSEEIAMDMSILNVVENNEEE